MSKMAFVFLALLLIAGCAVPKAKRSTPTVCVDFSTGKPFKCPAWMAKPTMVSAVPAAHGDN